MKNASLKTLSIVLFLFTLYAHFDYIRFYSTHGHVFLSSNIVAMGQVAIALFSIFIAFARSRYFWWVCVAYFLSYPLDFLLISSWFPDYIYADKLGVRPSSIRERILDIPVLLLFVCIAVYVFISRKESKEQGNKQGK